MAGLDLTGIRAVVDGWLVDTLKIARDNGNADDVLDEETGLLSPAGTIAVYDGPGAVQPLDLTNSGVPDPDVARYYQESGARYRALLPLSAPADIRAGDLVQVVAVMPESSDADLLVQTWQAIDKPAPSSFAVLRVVYLKPV